ncbi:MULTISPECIES: hypothetical protein [Chryseobacterium]|uniref:hypothetical protein n=1 Tax=Chryseobacterium TaxID=59732 RepID=UPI00140A1E35|nr:MULTISPECIES: hypothetical protein [Chryseobacterium]
MLKLLFSAVIRNRPKKSVAKQKNQSPVILKTPQTIPKKTNAATIVTNVIPARFIS